VSREFFNRRAATWDEKVAEKDSTRLEMLLSRLDIAPGAKVLDVGTGTGVFVPYLLRKIGEKGELVCLDFAEEMLNIARTKRFPGNIDFICADIGDSALPDGAFDAVICYSVFPHFEDKPKVLREIYRVLRPGGRLYVAHTSSREEINNLHRSMPEVRSHLIPESDELENMLIVAGFEDITIDDGEDSYFASAGKPINPG
jgi:ubiquinone/menaquinone biosynthesis C-methylase UbiE